VKKIIALTFTLSALVAACSSSDTTPATPATDSGKGDSVADVGKDTAVPTDTGGAKDTAVTDTSGGVDATCGAKATNDLCQACCRTNHAAAYKAWSTLLLTCGCKVGNCDTACAATACATPPVAADATCIKCLGDIQGTGCKADLEACGTAACADFDNCIIDQDCNGKP